MRTEYRAEKAVAAVGYLVSETSADLYSVMKMFYLADKVHLQSYGRTIAGDRYVAMEKGPVPERTYNLCKYVSGRRANFDPLPGARAILRLDGNEFHLLTEPDTSELSRSDLAALDEAAAIYKQGGWRAVFKASHDGAWTAAWDEAEARGIKVGDMHVASIAATLPNASSLIEYLADPHPGEENECPDSPPTTA